MVTEEEIIQVLKDSNGVMSLSNLAASLNKKEIDIHRVIKNISHEKVERVLTKDGKITGLSYKEK